MRRMPAAIARQDSSGAMTVGVSDPSEVARMTSMPLRNLCLTGMALALAACAGEPRRSTPLDQRNVERLAAVRVDPAAASRILNGYRASRGLSPVRLDPALTAMAQRQADAMVAANALSHDAGGSFQARVHAAGLDAARAAENLGAGYYSTEEAFTGWRNSAGHDANLRMIEATRFGIALAKDPQTQYRAWWALVIAGDAPKRQELSAGPVGYFGSNLPIPR